MAKDVEVDVLDDPKAENGDADDEGAVADVAKALNGDTDEISGAFVPPKVDDGVLKENPDGFDPKEKVGAVEPEPKAPRDDVCPVN